MSLPSCRLRRFPSAFSPVAAAAPRRRRLPTRSVVAAALAGGVALLLGALGPCATTVLAAAPATPSTTGFIVAVPSTGAATSAGTALRAAPLGRATDAAPFTLGARRAQVLPAGIGPDGRAATTVDTGARFDMIGVLFRSTSAGVRAAQLDLRVSLDGLSWTPWFAVRADAQSGPAGSVESAADLVTEPVWVGVARYVQYEAGGAPVGDVRFACIDSQVAAPAAPEPSAAATGAATTVPTMASAASMTAPTASATASAVSPTAPDAVGAAVVAATTVGGPPEPTIVSRAKWGADESLRSNSPSYGVVRCAFVHHTVNANTYSRSQAPALVRGIYYYHTQVNGWNDIGYNFLIDRFGTIYEGRYGGVASAVSGAQVLGFNSMSTGVSLIGTFQSVAPSQAALTSLERLLAWKLDLSHLDPQGTSRVECFETEKYRAGQWVTVPVIVGHRQVNYTECPGNVLFGMLPAIRAAVAQIGDPKIYTPSASPRAFSPNGDGVRDSVSFKAGLSGNDGWTIALSNAAGSEIARFAGTGTTASAVWNGRDAGVRAPDGTYTATFDAASANGTARPASLAIRLDTVDPVISGLAVSPAMISPNGDRSRDSAQIALTASEAGTTTLGVRNAVGAVVRTVGPTATKAGQVHLVWDGKVSSGAGLAVAADGSYSVVVGVTDAAGNTTTATRAVVVDDTIGHASIAPVWLSPNGDGASDTTLLSFRQTRTAKVSVAVARPNGAVVRRVALGSLASGAHAWRWDGKDAGGDAVADGAYICTLSATNAVGTTVAAMGLRVDTAPPVAAWRLGAVTMKLGKTLHAAYRATDQLSPKASATIVARSSAGIAVSSATPPAAAVGVLRSWSFKPKARGTYTVTLVAVDLAGNRQAVGARLTIKVT
jgi:flagellar hook assembly protein FlgD